MVVFLPLWSQVWSFPNNGNAVFVFATAFRRTQRNNVVFILRHNCRRFLQIFARWYLEWIPSDLQIVWPGSTVKTELSHRVLVVIWKVWANKNFGRVTFDCNWFMLDSCTRSILLIEGPYGITVRWIHEYKGVIVIATTRIVAPNQEYFGIIVSKIDKSALCRVWQQFHPLKLLVWDKIFLNGMLSWSSKCCISRLKADNNGCLRAIYIHWLDLNTALVAITNKNRPRARSWCAS